jgi:hypothetical protein
MSSLAENICLFILSINIYYKEYPTTHFKKSSNMTKNAPGNKKHPKPQSSTSSLLEPQDPTESPAPAAPSSQIPKTTTGSETTTDDESEENKSYVRGYNDALDDMNLQGSISQMLSPSETAWRCYWYPYVPEGNEDVTDLWGYLNSLRDYGEQIRQHLDYLRDMQNLVSVSVRARPRARRAGRRRSSRNPATARRVSGSQRNPVEQCLFYDSCNDCGR